MIAHLAADLVLDARARTGEGPVWHAAAGALVWVDIPAGRVHRYYPAVDMDDVVDFGCAIGAAVPRASGGLVLATEHGFAVSEKGADDLVHVAPFLEGDDSVRMNDGKCDRLGRFWAGTMAYDLRAGAAVLCRLDTDHSVHTVLPGVTLSNGLDWSDDGGTMYYIDSLAFGVDALDVDMPGGTVSNRRRLVDIPNDPTSPCGFTLADGLTVDAEGQVWVAIHGAGEVRRYDPRGRLTQVVELPVACPTSVAFGGEDLGDLYITSGSAHSRAGTSSADGGLFRCRPGVRGRLANLFGG